MSIALLTLLGALTWLSNAAPPAPILDNLQCTLVDGHRCEQSLRSPTV